MNGYDIRYIYVPPLPKEPAPFISIEDAQRMKMDEHVKVMADKMGIISLPTEPPRNPSMISDEITRRQMKAKMTLMDFIKRSS
jgi:hypothetical protein